MTDAVSGQSRGYGFVRFSDETDQQRALVEMQGVYCGSRPMRISTATPKNRYVHHGWLRKHRDYAADEEIDRTASPVTTPPLR